MAVQVTQNFQKLFPFDKRKAESERIRKKYQDRIPLIVEKAEHSDIAIIDKKKYLVPQDLTIGQFIFVIRKRLKLEPEKSIFLFIGNTIPPMSALISEIYNQHKNLDGFLYVTYSSESAFGGY